MKNNQSFYSQLLEVMWKASVCAGDYIMAHYKSSIVVEKKCDDSPLTIADKGSEAIILGHLRAAFPDIAIIAEEEVANGVKTALTSQFFLVDPLDGTREFIAKNGEFTVNIAFVEDGCPILGVIFIPALQKLYVGGPQGAFLFDVHNQQRNVGTKIVTRPMIDNPVAVVSRSHRCKKTDDWLDGHHITNRLPIGSSLKFCLLAEGRADIYPRFEPCMTWDVAAGDAILRAAGGIMVDESGNAMQYGKNSDAIKQCHQQTIFFAVGDSVAFKKRFE